MKKLHISLIILSVSLFLRLLYLGCVPVALSHDETDNIIQAHALIQTGHDIEGAWTPWHFLPNSGVMAELGPVINAPMLSILPQSIFSSRLTTAILSSFFPLLICYWLLLIGVNSYISLTSAVMLAISPWHLIFSRTALEQPTSLFFYILSWILLSYIFQTNKSRKLYILYSISFVLTYAIAFFTYHGYKFSFPILTFIYLGWLSYHAKSERLLKFAFGFLVISSLVVRTVIFSSYYGSRSSEIGLANEYKFANEVDNARKMSVAPSFANRLFINKPRAIFDSIVAKYISAISPDMLFVRGESNGVFSVMHSGYLYLFTLPLVILGIVALCRFNSKQCSLFLMLFIVSPISTILHVNNSFAFRSAIYFVLLNIILSYGIWYLRDLLSQHYPKLIRLFYFSLTILFTGGLLSFCYNSYFVSPIANSSDYFFPDRVLSNYVRLDKQQKIMIVDPQPRYIYSSIVLSQGTPDLETINSFGHSYSPVDVSSYNVDNLTVVQSCSKIDSGIYDTIIVHKNMIETSLRECKSIADLMSDPAGLPPHSIVSPKDSGEVYRIYADNLCSGMELGRYVRPTNLSDFSLESMSSELFCQKWIVSQ